LLSPQSSCNRAKRRHFSLLPMLSCNQQPEAITDRPLVQQAEAIVHLTANGKILRRSYQEFADRARGLAYYIKNKGYKRVGILAPNTPAFLESIYGIAAGGALQVGINYRLKAVDIH